MSRPAQVSLGRVSVALGQDRVALGHSGHSPGLQMVRWHPGEREGPQLIADPVIDIVNGY